MRQRINQIVDPKPVCEVSVFCGEIPIVGMFPTIAHIRIPVDQNHNSTLVIKNRPIFRIHMVRWCVSM